MSMNRPRQNCLICSDKSVCEVLVSFAGSGTPSGVFDLAIHISLLDKLRKFNLSLEGLCVIKSKFFTAW